MTDRTEEIRAKAGEFELKRADGTTWFTGMMPASKLTSWCDNPDNITHYRLRLPAVDWEVLAREALDAMIKIKDCIDRGVINDTIWMPDDVCKGATLFDFIDAFLDHARKAGVE